jgi:hypothetical protein
MLYSLHRLLISLLPACGCCVSSQNIASISAGNDDSVGEMIADALDKVRHCLFTV